MKLPSSFALFFILFTSSTLANELNLVREHEYGDTTYNQIITEENTLYVATDGVLILDVSDPAQPTELAKLRLGSDGRVETLQKVGNLLFVQAYDEIHIFNVADRSTLTQIASIQRPEDRYFRSFTVKDDRLYIGIAGVTGEQANLEDTSLLVYDVSQASEPKLITQRSLPDIGFGNLRLGTTLGELIVQLPEQLLLFDLTEGQYLTQVYSDSQVFTYFPYEMPTSGDVAYFSENGNLIAYDFSSLANVTKKETYTGSNDINEMAVSGSTLYFVDKDSHVSTYDISTLISPRLIERAAEPVWTAFGCCAKGPNTQSSVNLATLGHYLVTGTSDQITVQKNALEQGQFVKFDGSINDIVIADDTLIVSATSHTYFYDLKENDYKEEQILQYGLRGHSTYQHFVYTKRAAYDTSQPDSIQSLGAVDSSFSYLTESTVNKNELVIADTRSITTYSLTTPESPVKTHEYDVYSLINQNYQPTDIEVFDEQYILATTNGLMRFAVDEEQQLVLLENADQGDYISHLEVNDNLLFFVNATGNDTLSILDMSNSNSPKHLSSISHRNIQAIAVKDNWLAVATYYYGVYLYDISDPQNPQIIVKTDDHVIHYTAIEFYNNTLFVTSFDYLQVYTINLAPKIKTEELVLNEDERLSLTIDVENIEQDQLVFQIAGHPRHGSAEINASGELIYLPERDYNGSDSLELTVIDQYGGDSTKQISIVINSVNDAPVAQNGNFITTESETVSGKLTAIDPDGDNVLFAIAQDPQSGVVEINTDGLFSYTPNAGFTGSDSFTFFANDAESAPSEGTITINVQSSSASSSESPAVSSGSSGGGSISWLGLMMLFTLQLVRIKNKGHRA